MNRRGRPNSETTRPHAVARRWLALLALLVLIGVVAAIVLRNLDPLELLREHRAGLISWRDEHLLAAAALFVLVYIAVVVVSLPINFAMTALGGFLFGFVAGTLLSILAVTAAALLVFRVAKANLGDSLRQRLLEQASSRVFERVDRGFRRNGAWYLLLLRVTPTLPSIVPNAAPAFFAVSTRTFLVTTLIGVVPSTFVTAWIGSGLADVLAAGEEPAELPAFDPYVIGAVLLALAAIAAAALVFRRSS